MLKQENVNIESIKFFPKNARVHRKKNLDAIKESLSRFGQVEPLVLQKSTSYVLGGNGRLEAMKSLGWEKVSCVHVDVSDKEALALSVALNRTSELSEWDVEALQEVMSFVKDDKDLLPGWSDDELSAMLDTSWEVEEIGEVLNEDSEAANGTDHADSAEVGPESLKGMGDGTGSSTNTYTGASDGPQAVPVSTNSLTASAAETALLFSQHDNIEEFMSVCILAATKDILEEDTDPESKWEILKEKAGV